MKQLYILILLSLTLPVQASQDPNRQVIHQYLQEHYHNDKAGIEFSLLSNTAGLAGTQYYYGIQTFEGVPLFGTNFNVAIVDGKVIHCKQRFVSISALSIIRETTFDHQNALLEVLPEGSLINETGWTSNEVHVYTYRDEGISDEDVQVSKIWFLKDSSLIMAWEVSYYLKDGTHWYNYRIDAGTGQILDVNDWVLECKGAASQYQEASHSHSHFPEQTEVQESQETHANSSYRVFAMPVESPNHGNRTTVADPADAAASPYGWHDANGVEGPEYLITRGNNVFARDDRSALNAGGSSPNGGSSLIFNDTFNINQSPVNFLDAVITNLFYWNNIMHDVWYQYGFDEQSGNFQMNNYGRGGAGSDFVFADAQDGSGTNNANFATPDDGQNPRMQMYLWSVSNGGDFFMVNSPSFAAGKYLANRAGFGPQLTTIPLSGNLVLVQAQSGTAEDGCDTLSNAAEVNGKIALVQRGECLFVDKVRFAMDAGATAVVIYDNTSANPIVMGGSGNTSDITIPSVLITKNDGLYIKNLLSTQTVNVSLYDSSLTGEDVYDSDLDNGVIAHEYGHGISNRLTGGANASSCLRNAEQMGEGWSDFFALVMTHEPGDQGSDLRGIGTYVRGESVNGGGIRTYPYSTDMSQSLYTYDHIETLSVPHGVGSVWCSMLWDMYWSFIDQYGYDSDIYSGSGGNNMVMQLVIEGMKIQPCSPGFEDARDAILLADELLFEGINKRIIWEVFARRGLGYDADQGSPYDRRDGSSAFNIPPELANGLVISKTAETEIENGAIIAYTFKAINYSPNTIFNIELRDTLPEGMSVKTEDLSCPAQLVDNVLIITIDSIQRLKTFQCSVPARISVSNTTSVLYETDFENGIDDWTISSIVDTATWRINTDSSVSGNQSIFIPDRDVQSDQSISRSFTITGFAATLAFNHYYNTESTWDGGVVEIFSLGQWIDAGPYFIQNTYNSVIQNNPQSALSGRKAFTGKSDGFIKSRIDLKSFKGQTISIRFRYSSDGAVGGEGWYIDDVLIEDIVVIENFLHARFESKKAVSSWVTFLTGDGIPVAVSELPSYQEILIYPNPASASITIESDLNEELEVQVFDNTGKLIVREYFKGSGSIASEDLSQGIYYVQVRTSTGILRKKIIIQH